VYRAKAQVMRIGGGHGLFDDGKLSSDHDAATVAAGRWAVLSPPAVLFSCTVCVGCTSAFIGCM
jgi:hypothetical protein